jgi:hypothetical protein
MRQKIKIDVVDVRKYGGEWIAYSEKSSGKIFAHGKDFKKVFALTKRKIKKPVFEYVPSEETLVLCINFPIVVSKHKGA